MSFISEMAAAAYLIQQTKKTIKQALHREVTYWKNAYWIADDLEEDYSFKDLNTPEEILQLLIEMKTEGLMDFWPEKNTTPSPQDGEWRSIPQNGLPILTLMGEKTGSILLKKDQSEAEQMNLPYVLEEAQKKLGLNPTKVHYRSRLVGWEPAIVKKIDGEYLEGVGDNSHETFREWIGNHVIRKMPAPPANQMPAFFSMVDTIQVTPRGSQLYIFK